MPRRNIKVEGEVLPPYSVHEQHAAELGRLLLGPPLSRHEKMQAAVEDATSRGKDQQDKAFAICHGRVVVWPL